MKEKFHQIAFMCTVQRTKGTFIGKRIPLTALDLSEGEAKRKSTIVIA